MSATWPLRAFPCLYDMYENNSLSVWLGYEHVTIFSLKTILKYRLLHLKASVFFPEMVSFEF